MCINTHTLPPENIKEAYGRADPKSTTRTPFYVIMTLRTYVSYQYRKLENIK